MEDGTAYEVTVKKQPAQPPQYCEVRGGTGEVAGDDVKDIEVHCGSAGTVFLAVTRDESDGSVVVAKLYSAGAGPQLVAEAPPGMRLTGGNAGGTMVIPGTETEASLAGGTYHLYVYINHNNSTAGGKATFDVGDVGAVRVVEVREGEQVKAQLYAGDVEPLVVAPVTARVPRGEDPQKGLDCYWSPPGTGVMALPTDRASPVIGRSRQVCEDYDCFQDNVDGARAQTSVHDAMPRGPYDLTCWTDANGSGDYDAGDFWGYRPEVPVVGLPAALELEEVR